MSIAQEKFVIRDSVSAVLGKLTGKPHGRTRKEKMAPRSNVHVELFGPDGELKYEEFGENLVTDYGDDMIATRMYDDAIEIVTGMKLGTGATAAAKNGAGATLVTWLTTSQEALDGTATEATKGAGLGWRIEFVCTWIAGDITNGALAEVVLTNETPLTSVDSTAGDVIARFVFASTIDKQVGDSLVVTWQVDFLGA
jgi:hypothetical protein